MSQGTAVPPCWVQGAGRLRDHDQRGHREHPDRRQGKGNRRSMPRSQSNPIGGVRSRIHSQASRDFMMRTRGIQDPEMIIAQSAHPAFVKVRGGRVPLPDMCLLALL